MIRRHPRSTPFPYTPLFRPFPGGAVGQPERTARLGHGVSAIPSSASTTSATTAGDCSSQSSSAGATGTPLPDPASARLAAAQRSEEHTSELQSRQYLVCRLL